MNCPFYGRSGVIFPTLVDTLGNQCALVMTAHSPCQMETAGLTPDWRRCVVVDAAFGAPRTAKQPQAPQ